MASFHKINFTPTVNNNGEGNSGNAGGYFAQEEDNKKKQKEKKYLDDSELHASFSISSDVFVSSQKKQKKPLFDFSQEQKEKIKQFKLDMPSMNDPVDKAIMKLNKIEKILGNGNKYDLNKLLKNLPHEENKEETETENIFAAKEIEKKSSFTDLVEKIKDFIK